MRTRSALFLLCPLAAAAPLKTIPVGESPESVCKGFHGKLLCHRNGKLSTLATGFRGADSIERDSKGKPYVSSWSQGKVWKLDPDATNPQVIAEDKKECCGKDGKCCKKES